MPEAPFEAICSTFKRAAAALRDGEVRFMLGGGLAAWARGGPITQNDLDLVVAPADAERALAVLETAGMRTERPPEEWLLKAYDGDVLVDLIFHPRGLPVDEALFERADEMAVLSVTVPVMALEDVLVAKLLSLDEQRDLDYSSLLAIARSLREQIDWDEVRERTADSPYAKAFFTLAEELGLSSQRSVSGAAQG
jgi:Uncharacterised nucleotidyltransferase